LSKQASPTDHPETEADYADNQSYWCPGGFGLLKCQQSALEAREGLLEAPNAYTVIIASKILIV
jgi:hypothetical protein